MSGLSFTLRYGNSLSSLNLDATSVIETTLNVSPSRATLPTLVSIENIIERIQTAGYELASSDEVRKVATLINRYFMTTLKSEWEDKSLILQVNPIRSEFQVHYNEISRIRHSVIQGANEVLHFESQNNPVATKQSQDRVVTAISDTIQERPDWWRQNRVKILQFVGKSALSGLVEAVVGVPIESAITGVMSMLDF